MSNAIIPASAVPSAPPSVPAPAPKRARPKGVLAWGKKYLLQPLASLRLTVILFALALVLVFCGTLAQVDNGIWTVVNKYFRSYGIIWIPLQIFFPRDFHVGGGFPFPGGWLLGGLLLANLLAAHALRFRFRWQDNFLFPIFGVSYWFFCLWQDSPADSLPFVVACLAMIVFVAGLLWIHTKRSGVILLHLGLIVMMLSELVTGLYAIEGNMTIEEGKFSNAVVHHGSTELVIIDRSNPKTDDVVAVPARMLRKGETVRNELLPFDVEVLRYMVNSALARESADGGPNLATHGFGLKRVALERPEVSGTDPKQKVDIPAAYVTFKKKGTGESLGTYLVSLWLVPQEFTFEGKPYEVALRFKESYRPFTLFLKKFTHEVYEGTEKPKTYASLVHLNDPEHGEDRDILISMNAPMRYRGETFFQADFLRDGQVGTVLQVVRNPGWLMPYVSCFMVGLGMLIHFGQHLVTFLLKQRAAL